MTTWWGRSSVSDCTQGKTLKVPSWDQDYVAVGAILDGELFPQSLLWGQSNDQIFSFASPLIVVNRNRIATFAYFCFLWLQSRVDTSQSES